MTGHERDGSASKDTFCKPGSGFDPGISHGRRRELTFPSCSVTSHMYHGVHVHTHIHKHDE